MSADLLSILNGADDAPAVDPDLDAAIRTIYGEADGEGANGQQAVAAVIRNRAAAKHQPFSVIVHEPGAFDAWTDPKRAPVMEALDPSSPQYQAIAQAVAPVFSGEVDPTNGADHYYNPKLQASNGAPVPAWAKGDGLTIGNHVFYKVGDAEASPQAAATAAPKSDLATILGASPDIPVEENPLPPAAANPANPPLYPGKSESQSPGQNFLVGLGRGLDDTGATLFRGMAHLAPPQDGFGAAQVDAAIKRGRDDYQKNYGTSPNALGGRLIGSTIATAPLLAAGGEALAPLAEVAGPAGTFLSGAYRGNKLLQFGSRAARGMEEGAAGAALNSSASDQPLPVQMGVGAAGGAAVSAGLPALLAGGRGAVNVATGLVEPFTDSGRGKIANRLIGKFAEGGPTAIDGAELIPGSKPDLAQATANPGIATLTRGVRDVRPNPFVERETQNGAAREVALEAVRGDPLSLDQLIEARTNATDPIRQAAFSNAQPTDPSNVIAKIDEILASPAGQRDIVVSALKNLRSKIAQPGANGATALQTDPAQLYGVRQALTDMLSPLARGTASDARAASSELMQVKGELDKAIEAGAPGYKSYLSTFSDMSKPVDEQQLLQARNFTDSKGNITLAKVDSTIKMIEAARQNPGANGAKSVSDGALATLTALRADLVRQSNSGLGKSLGSNTFQNLATNNLLGRLGTPLAYVGAAAAHHPFVGGALALGRFAYKSQNDAIIDELANRLLNPELGGSALRPKPRRFVVGGPIPQLVRGFNDNAAVPAALLGNRLLGPPQSQVNQ